MKLNKKVIYAILALAVVAFAAIIFLILMRGAKMKNIAVIETSKGNIEVELYPEKAPETVKNFKAYAESGFFDGTVFHRVMSGFMIQGGGFLPDGTQKKTSPAIKLESRNGLRNEKGTISMARTSVPDSATSQFFINTENNSFLNYQSPANPGYAVFGKVISGMEVVSEIESSETETRGFYDDWPVEDVIIEKISLKK